jgi:hypothetical protein
MRITIKMIIVEMRINIIRKIIEEKDDNIGNKES